MSSFRRWSAEVPQDAEQPAEPRQPEKGRESEDAEGRNRAEKVQPATLTDEVGAPRS